MLTKEKIQAILKAPLTDEDRLIKVLYENGGLLHINDLIDKYKYYKTAVQLIVKKSFYIELDKMELVKLNYKGKEYKGLYNIPEKAENLENMVFSMLVQDYGLSFQDSLRRVVQFCKAKDINYDRYVQNRNCFDTIKKQVGKYLDTKLARPDNWYSVTSDTLFAWKKRKKIA